MKKMNIYRISFSLLIFTFLSLVLFSCSDEEYPYYIKYEELSPKIDHGYLWVANSGDNSVTCINRFADSVVGTYQVGPNPSRTAVDLKGNCWVGSRDDGTVYFVTTSGITKKYSGFNAARGVALDIDGNVWIANSGDPSIQKINAKNDSVYAKVTISGATYFYGALVDANNFLWVLNLKNVGVCGIFRINIKNFPELKQNEDIKFISLSSCYGFTIDMNNTVWVSGNDENKLYKINADSVKIDAVYTVPNVSSQITGVTFDIFNNIWISNYGGNRAVKFDQNAKVFKNVSLPGVSNPHGIAADDQGFVYTVNRSSNNVSKILADSAIFIKNFAVGRDPYTYSDLTGFIYRRVTLKSKW